jgi:serralysin
MSRPVITGSKTTVLMNQSIPASELFTLTPGSNPIAFLYFEDFNTTPSSGYFTLNGVPQPQGQRITITLDQLSGLRYVGGSRIGFERARIFARDTAGQVSDVSMTATIFSVRPNTTAPFAQARNFSVVADEFIRANEFISGFDPDGWPIVSFQIRDLNQDNGYFSLNGVNLPQGTWFTVDADDLINLRYYTSGPNATETIEVISYDGVMNSLVSRGVATTIVNASRPVARYVDRIVPGDQTLRMVDAFDIFDADQNTMKIYRVMNAGTQPQHGELVYNGNVLPRQTWFEYTADEIGNLRFVPQNVNASQAIRYRAFDGRHWSAINTVQVASEFVIPPTKPEFRSVLPEYYDSQRVNRPLRQMFQKLDAGIPYTQYEIFQASTNNAHGFFATNGLPRQRGVIHRLTPAQFNNTVYVTGAYEQHLREPIFVRASNGQFWSDWEKVDFSTYPEIFNTLSSGASWSNAPMSQFIPVNVLGQQVLSYSFMQQFPDYETGEAVDNDPPENFAAFNAQQRAHARLGLAQLEAVANVQLVEVPDTSVNVLGQRGGIFRMGEYGLEDSDAAAFAFLPSMGPEGGDMWFNRLTMDTRLIPGSSSFTTFLHEFGHALGLKHPFSGFGNLPPAVDTSGFSVMSYTRPFLNNPTTFSLYDIHQLQQQYGANNNYRTGENIYDLDFFRRDRGGSGQGNRFDEVVFASIWDAGGVDTLSAKDSLFGATVDLRAGMPSSIGHFFDLFALIFQGQFVEVPAVNNVRIAIGTEIENATGSDHDDILIGNHRDNILRGGEGNDYLWGGTGNDLLLGGPGDNTYEFGVGEGFNRINQQGFGGQHTLRISRFPTVNLLQEDLVFRRISNDLVVDLRVDRGDSQGVMRILNHYVEGNHVQTLEFNGTRVDLMDLSEQIAGPGNHSFRIRNTMGANGFLVAPA